MDREDEVEEDEEEEEVEDIEGSEELEKTPTKKTKFGIRPGVDLAKESAKLVETPPSKRKKMDTSAFFALRPGSAPNTSAHAGASVSDEKADDDMPAVRRSEARKGVTVKQPGDDASRRSRKRRDWSYQEKTWILGPQIAEQDEKDVSFTVILKAESC